MRITSTGQGIRIHGLSDFHPQHVFECGQAFRWNWDGQGYIGVVGNRAVRTLWDGTSLVIENTTADDFQVFWRDYFDLDTDYGRIKTILSSDPIIAEAVKYGWGIRILNQDPWETLISFIISANNGIKRIKGIIERLSYKFGEKILWGDKEYYMFPSVSSLAEAHEDELRDCGCGYRGPYIKATAQLLQERDIDLHSLKCIDDYELAYKTLLKFKGVGPKVADCIALFALKKGEAFPVDVWVKRIMDTLYHKDMEEFRDIKDFAKDRFGGLAGYAQQYLFFYAREKGIGK
ncbi:MAG TPA: DNA glycosylase [Clostridia bacterium]|nr:DNA glycosylase [Clostridia bacterium]